MQVVAFVVIVGAFLGGLGAARRFLPSLASSVEGRLSSWVVAILLGASAGVIAAHIWLGVRTLTESNQSDLQPRLHEEIITSMLQAVLLQGGALLALAAIVYLLAPTSESTAEG